MKDVLGRLQDIQRPPLLIRAARLGVEHYSRERHLPRLLGGPAPDRSGPALLQLMEREAVLNEERIRDAASYSIAEHLDVLVAMMAEARRLADTPAIG